MTDLSTCTTSAATPIEFTTLQNLIADCLGLDIEDIQPECRFFDDLGGESIDLLELSFQFEKHFRRRVQFKSLLSKEMLERDSQGKLSQAAAESLRRQFPGLDLVRRLETIDPNNPRALLTIEFMHELLQFAPEIETQIFNEANTSNIRDL